MRFMSKISKAVFGLSVALTSATVIGPAPAAAQSEALPLAPNAFSRGVPPPGFEYPFDDGRLNPARAQGTARGQAQMERLWTNTVPRRETEFARQLRTSPEAAALYREATGERATAHPTRSGRYVQVGSFTRSGNAQHAAFRIERAGLPARITRSGQYQVVLAGPFGSAAQTRRAVAQVRQAGYHDAFVR